jgi:hypothetical protein
MLKGLTLGSAGSAADMILISAATNATPIVITVSANNGLKSGDRIAIAGITGNTAANGEWTLAAVTATTFQLLGSAGNGTYGGTPRVALLFDTTPLMRGHTAVLKIAGNMVGTITFTSFNSYAEFSAADNSLLGANVPLIKSAAVQGVTNTSSSSASSSTKATSVLAIAATNQCGDYEVILPRYLTPVVSAYTSGTTLATIQA